MAFNANHLSFPKGIVPKQCTKSDLNKIVNLQQIVLDAIENPETLIKITEQDFLAELSPPHYILGLWQNNKLIALTVLLLPNDNLEDNLALDIPSIPSGSASANYELALVHPNYRGLGLQALMEAYIESIAIELGITYLCGIVSPYNKFSQKNLEKRGYTFSHQTKKYSGLLRNVMYKKL